MASTFTVYSSAPSAVTEDQLAQATRRADRIDADVKALRSKHPLLAAGHQQGKLDSFAYNPARLLDEAASQLANVRQQIRNALIAVHHRLPFPDDACAAFRQSLAVLDRSARQCSAIARLLD